MLLDRLLLVLGEPLWRLVLLLLMLLVLVLVKGLLLLPLLVETPLPLAAIASWAVAPPVKEEEEDKVGESALV